MNTTMKNATLTMLMGAAMTACVPPTDHDDTSAMNEESGESESTGAPEPSCPATTTGPVLHGGDIEGHEIWRAEDGPHVVMTSVRVRDGATLEIEPCAVVQFSEATNLEIAFPGTPNTGTLLAEGEAERPIRFEGLHGARWGHVFVQSPGTARLAHLTIEGGGGVDGTGASLIAMGEGTWPTQRGLFVDHVTVTGSLGAGVVATRLAAFAEGSTTLVVTESGNDEHPFPVELDEHAIGSLPDGEYTGNLVDEILVEPLQNLQESATMRDPGVPWRIGTSAVDRLTIGAGEREAPVTTLTIEAGATLRFHPGTSLQIDHVSGDAPATGNLVAIGTATSPVTFTSAADAPAPGDWVGLWFGGIVNAETHVEHARIEYAGADCGCVLVTCNDLDGFEGAVIMSMPPSSMFMTDSVIAHSAGHGFVLGYTGADLDFASSNEFDDVAGCDATLPSSDVCPEPRPSCG